MRRLITVRGRSEEPSPAQVGEHLATAEREGFWLDIERPGDEDLELLLNVFRFHPLTVEDVRQRNQRPKLDVFGRYAFAVIFTVEWRDGRLRFLEHHLYVAPHVLVTVHQEPAPAFDELRGRIRHSPELTRREPAFLQYLVVNELVVSLFPALERLDEGIERLEDLALGQPTPQTLRRITRLKHQVTDLRRILTSQRDAFQRLASHAVDFHHEETTLYWNDVHAELVRQYELVDSLRDLLVGAMDIYLSTASNRLNATIQRLTVVASLFLPLTFLTGFFGMNFGFLVNVISGPAALALAVALMLAAVGGQLYFFRRRGWI